VADLNPQAAGGWALSEGWCECPCAGCGEALLIQQGDEVCVIFADDGRVAYLLCHACAKRNNEECRRRQGWTAAGRTLRRIYGVTAACFAALAVALASFGFCVAATWPAAGAAVLTWGLWLTRPHGREGA
jgi:hypothetical protein